MAKRLKVTKMGGFPSDEEAQYRLRSHFMYKRQSELLKVIELLKTIDPSKIDWHNPNEIGISQSAFDYVKGEGTPLTHIFCHPRIIEANPPLIAYYRSLAGLPQKGVSRLAFGVAKYEQDEKIQMGKAVDLAKILNSYISELIDSDPKFSVANAQLMVSMNYGAQINGSWRNAIGEEGTRRVKQILVGFLRDKKVIDNVTYKEGLTVPADKPIDIDQMQEIRLVNGYTLTFSPEPDVSLRDDSGSLVAVIETKAGIDKAGALERYGAAKKSFSSARRENKNVETIFLGLLTPTVKEEIKGDQLVTTAFSAGDVFSDRPERKTFLSRMLWLSHLEITSLHHPTVNMV